MKIGARMVGLLAWMVMGGHMLWSEWHNFRARRHEARRRDHEQKRDARLEEAASIEQAAKTLAPPKAKPAEVISPPPRKAALAAVATTPRVFRHGGNDQ
jgi:hypothetical protein